MRRVTAAALAAGLALLGAREAATRPQAGADAALARRASELPRAAAGAHEGWRGRPLPPLYDLALSAFERGDAPAALELLTVLLERHPDLPPATLMLGGVYFRLRRYEDAVCAYERFLAHAPEEVVRTRHLAHALHSLGRDAEAEGHYAAVLARTAEQGGLAGVARAHALRGLGLTLQDLGRLTEAREALLAALALSAGDAEIHLALARLDEQRGALPSAARAAARARELAPFDPRAAFLLANLLMDLGDPDGAAGHFAEFERLAPLDTRIRDLELRLLHRPADRAALVDLARLFAQLGDADAHRRALAQLGVESLEATVLTLELGAQDDPDAMRATLERLQTRYAEDPRAWDALETYYALIQDTARAAEARRRAAGLRRAAGGE